MGGDVRRGAATTGMARMRAYTDYTKVDPHHLPMHQRLTNWARWAVGRPGIACSPMFRLYRTTEQWEGAKSGLPVDSVDAARVSKGVGQLPQDHRIALNWYYIQCSPLKRIMARLGVSRDGLAGLVRDGRQMLVNRGI